MSPGKFSHKRDKLSKRANFKKRWQAFCEANFDSAAEIAYLFAVHPDTAATWLEGENAPGGWVIADSLENPDLAPRVIGFFGNAA